MRNFHRDIAHQLSQVVQLLPAVFQQLGHIVAVLLHNLALNLKIGDKVHKNGEKEDQHVRDEPGKYDPDIVSKCKQLH